MKQLVGLFFVAALAGCANSELQDAPDSTADTSKSELSSPSGREAESAPVAIPKFFVENNITQVRYAYVAMHDSDPKTEPILNARNLEDWQKELLVKADCGSWKKFYEDDRVCDGMRWVVEFVSDGRVVNRVDGFNAEPPGLKYLLRACGIRRETRSDSSF